MRYIIPYTEKIKVNQYTGETSIFQSMADSYRARREIILDLTQEEIDGLTPDIIEAYIEQAQNGRN